MKHYSLSINGKQKWFSLFGERKATHRTFFGEAMSKLRMPQFDGYLDGVQSIRFIDADSFRLTESMLLAGGACPFVGASGRLKGIILLNHPDPSDSAVLDTIRKQFGDDVADAIDPAGIRHSFINPSQFERISGFEFKAIEVVNDNHDWRLNTRITPSENEDVNMVASFIASNENGNEMDLSGKYLAEQTGWSLSRAYRAISDAVREGVIRVVDSSYKIGSRARRFALTVAAKTEGCLTIVFKTVPALIQDGMWWRMLLPTMRHFATFEQAESWFRSVDGCDAPGKRRWSKLKSAWNHHAKNHGLATI